MEEIKNRPKYDIIGDIHGCFDELMKLIKMLGYKKKGKCYIHPEGRILVSVGDIADKGDKNLKCLNFWINQVIYGNGIWVYGNHCNKFYKYLVGNKITLSHGIEKTVKEYQDLTLEEKKKFRYRFFKAYKSLEYYKILDEGKLIIVHGAIKEEYIGKINRKIKAICLYGDTTGKFDEFGKPIRNDWAAQYKGDALIVYGHTYAKEPVIRNNTVDIDQGCVYGGKLTALRYPEMTFKQVEGKEYVKYKGYICEF